jgi:hypothetical protein
MKIFDNQKIIENCYSKVILLFNVGLELILACDLNIGIEGIVLEYNVMYDKQYI